MHKWPRTSPYPLGTKAGPGRAPNILCNGIPRGPLIGVIKSANLDQLHLKLSLGSPYYLLHCLLYAGHVQDTIPVKQLFFFLLSGVYLS